MIINGIVLVPVYFKFMSVSTYGAWLATGNVVAMLGLVESGFSSVVTQKMSVALAEKKDKYFVQLASANLFTGTLMSMSILIVGLVLSFFLADWINADDSIHKAITIAFIISLASSSISLIVSFIGTFPQVWQETKITGLLSILANIFGILSLIFYLHLGFGVVALALGYLTRSVLNLLTLGIWVLLKWRQKKLSKLTFNISITKELLNESFYPFLNKISNVIMGNSQSFIISIFISPTTAAVYDITSKITVVGCNFVSMINSSFFGLLSLTFATKNKIDINKLIQRVSIIFITLLFSCLLYSRVFTEPIVYFWVGLDKYGGDILLSFIVLSTLIMHFKSYLNTLLYTGGLIKKSAIFDIMSMAMYLLLLFVLIKPLGIYAIPVALFSSGILFIKMYLRFLKRYLAVDIKNFLRPALDLFLTSIPFLLSDYLFNLNLFNFFNLTIYLTLFTIGYAIVIGTTNKAYSKMILFRLGEWIK